MPEDSFARFKRFFFARPTPGHAGDSVPDSNPPEKPRLVTVKLERVLLPKVKAPKKHVSKRHSKKRDKDQISNSTAKNPLQPARRALHRSMSDTRIPAPLHTQGSKQQQTERGRTLDSTRSCKKRSESLVNRKMNTKIRPKTSSVSAPVNNRAVITPCKLASESTKSRDQMLARRVRAFLLGRIPPYVITSRVEICLLTSVHASNCPSSPSLYAHSMQCKPYCGPVPGNTSIGDSNCDPKCHEASASKHSKSLYANAVEDENEPYCSAY